MDYYPERRSLSRFTIPGAKVKYKQEEGFRGSKAISGEGKLIDISLKAVKFEAQYELFPGALVDIEIVINPNQTIPVTGNILYSSETNENTPGITIVQFIRFGNEDGLNMIESKSQLEELQEKFLSENN